MLNIIPLRIVCDSVKDLGFTLTRTQCPLKYIQNICCKASILPRFLIRISAEFHLVAGFKVFFLFISSPNYTVLEYGSVHKDPSIATARDMVERVQRRFLSPAAHTLNIPYPPHNYSLILRIISLRSLANRRHSVNIYFLINLFTLNVLLFLFMYHFIHSFHPIFFSILRLFESREFPTLTIFLLF